MDPQICAQCCLDLESAQMQLMLKLVCAQALHWSRPLVVLVALSRRATVGRRAKVCRKLTGSRCACSCK